VVRVSRSVLFRGLVAMAVVLCLTTPSLASAMAKPMGKTCPAIAADACAKAMMQNNCCRAERPAMPAVAAATEAWSALSKSHAVAASYLDEPADHASVPLFAHPAHRDVVDASSRAPSLQVPLRI